MKCVCCGRKIGKNERRSYYWHKLRKRYACSECSDSGAFDTWIDSQPGLEDSDTDG
jgi:hypothetical protein